MFGEAPTRRDPDSPGGSPRLEPANQPKSRHDQLDIRSQESQKEVQIQVQHQAARDLDEQNRRNPEMGYKFGDRTVNDAGDANQLPRSVHDSGEFHRGQREPALYGESRSGQESLLSKTGTNLTTRVANGGFTCPELEF